MFCRLASTVSGETVIIGDDPYTQATLRERHAYLNTIRFDTFAWAENSKLYTLDMERSCKGLQLNRRTVYYSCRAISLQEVKNMAYDNINPVSISFILTEDGKVDKRRTKNKQDLQGEKAIRRVKLRDVATHEVFDTLIEIILVSVPIALRVADENSDLRLFARFFAVSSQDEADKFVDDYGKIELGKELIMAYNNAVFEPNTLKSIEGSDYYTGRLTEAQIEEERQRVEQKRTLKLASKMLARGISPELVAEDCELELSVVNSLNSSTIEDREKECSRVVTVEYNDTREQVLEVAKALILKSSVESIVKATGFTPEEIESLRNSID